MTKAREILFLLNLKGVGKKAVYSKYWNALVSSNNIDELVEYLKSSKSGFSKYDIDRAIEKSEEILNKAKDKDGINIITIFDEDYPDKLNVMNDKRPLVLYVRGNSEALKNSCISVVGTRSPSEWSIKVEENLVKRILELSDYSIVSGLALGCDRVAHEATVSENKSTIAVLPSGVDVITPASHKKLAEEILRTNGCLMSEYPPGTKAFKSSYVERDAIIAALSDITIVIECDVKSGTMHTVDAAEGYKRMIACYYPADMRKGSYAGNEYMVTNKGAYKLKDKEDLIELLNKPEVTQPASEKEENKQMSLFDYEASNNRKRAKKR